MRSRCAWFWSLVIVVKNGTESRLAGGTELRFSPISPNPILLNPVAETSFTETHFTKSHFIESQSSALK